MIPIKAISPHTTTGYVLLRQISFILYPQTINSLHLHLTELFL